MLVWLAVTLFGSSLALFSRLASCSWRLTGGDCCGRVGCIVLGSSALLLLLLALALYHFRYGEGGLGSLCWPPREEDGGECSVLEDVVDFSGDEGGCDVFSEGGDDARHFFLPPGPVYGFRAGVCEPGVGVEAEADAAVVCVVLIESSDFLYFSVPVGRGEWGLGEGVFDGFLVA